MVVIGLEIINVYVTDIKVDVLRQPFIYFPLYELITREPLARIRLFSVMAFKRSLTDAVPKYLPFFVTQISS